ncbi:chromosome segregation DNA-binding protein [Caminicella sporogenes DSM 14501]|uniref:Chromosome segregation DNA-binding protein n=1 Tax=Caminicella sporogenes DSM 14501 TaxID=1121266 RepID=A0A1M6NCY8_9FIRM|nr:ParB/RepB/Spo0J family partition protein [Caminicella sporogenes]RKD22239.1 chromosome partitioning protein ParB [Caminicella sporogenes]SHJ93602.1 chromosome segregation DNA-binding protein [Caminicella sporogenes DSM 14501]
MTKVKRGLGKGLSALIPQGYNQSFVDENSKDDKVIKMIKINNIRPNEKQPRKYFNEEKIKDLEESIREHGIVQPIIVRKIPSGFEIVAGERRWRAAKNASLKEIPCIIKDLNDEETVKLSLIENLQREDLNDIEEALAYKRLIDEYNMTQEKISRLVGKSRTYIANTLRLLNLSRHVKDLIIEGKITGGHGRALLRIKDEKLQKQVALKVIEENLTVREVEKFVAGLLEKSERKEKKKVNKDSNIIFLEETLKEVLGTKVNIVKGKKKGKIEIEYYSDDDLERIINLLKNN